MALLVWQPELDTGIDVIDQQHQRIVELINQLHHVRETHDRQELADVLEELVDYTLSHFAFEEELLEESGYAFGPAHKRVHDMFTRRVGEYRMRFEAGEDITAELHGMLARWLFNHIRNDDKSYSRHVRHYLEKYRRPNAEKSGDGWFKRRVKSWLN